MVICDSHIHLDDPRFDADRDDVVRHAQAMGVTGMVIPGVTAATWERTARVASSYPNVWPAFGLHPYFLAEHAEKDLAELDVRLRGGGAVAVGECGLDYFLEDLDPAGQQTYFEAQLELADAHALPVIVHSRKSLDQVIAALRRHSGVRAHIHSFAGSEQQAGQLIDLGCVLGIGANVTFERAQRLRRVVAAVPLDSLCVETDAPDQPGSGHRGERHEPAWIREVVEAIAAIRHEDPEHIAVVTCENARRFFSLPEDSEDV